MRARMVVVALALLVLAVAVGAEEPGDDVSPAAKDGPVWRWEPLFVGYESEPGMDFGGRTVASLQSGLARAIGRIGRVGERAPALAPLWEVPLAGMAVLVQHEVGGHGGRGREFGLGPSYSFGLDFSGSTSIRRIPETNEQGTLLAAGGSEADGVLAHRILLDALRSDGTDGARLPLLLLCKLDLSHYVFGTKPPRGAGFVEQYRDGNDIALYLVSRQAARRRVPPSAVWRGMYRPDLGDPLLQDNWDRVRAAAVWNALDPTLVTALLGYVTQHARDGQARVRMPVWRVGRGLGLLAGTRAALGPGEVSRFLDVYLSAPWGVLAGYVRDLDSSRERTWGYGVAVHGVRVDRATFGASADRWKEPEAGERPRCRSCWHAALEAEVVLGGRWGVAAKLGGKSEGFFPGRPMGDGLYVGLGVTAAL
ncbi:MAG: hypothetical protein KA072_07170 [Thermoanaerobaculaceae bacterium]|nr:hypothetical protein [Thermoanaerobaculaceae bacterium]MDI9622467.1 hypothetical protein [Acidobacteriota bacterium]NLH09778.1 hypothetical protein [Holophagae bacterium]